jgi:hypothetical protein
MKKLSELTKAIRAVSGVMNLLGAPGTEMESKWLMVKRAAESTEVQKPSDSSAMSAIALLRRWIDAHQGADSLLVFTDTINFLQRHQ